MVTLDNPIARIKDPKRKAQVTEICKRLQVLHNEGRDIDAILMDMHLPLTIHFYITANFSQLMELTYT